MLFGVELIQAPLATHFDQLRPRSRSLGIRTARWLTAAVERRRAPPALSILRLSFEARQAALRRRLFSCLRCVELFFSWLLLIRCGGLGSPSPGQSKTCVSG